MANRSCFFLVCALTLAGCHRGEAPKVDAKPNIVLILADDMGWKDLGCYGGKAKTPHLDQLASQGVRFTDMYAAAPNCSPSRVGFLTGRNPAMVGMYNYRPPGHPMHLRQEEVTIAELLKGEGYATGHFGKWHLGCLPQDTTLRHPQPHDQGFDYSLGTENNAQPSHLNPTNFVRNGVELSEQRGYACQIVADEVIEWLDRRDNRKQPFFSYVAFHEPHKKVASPPKLVNEYPGWPTADAEYLANVQNLDSAAGRIIDYLKVHDLFENTIILFASDNGSYRQRSNGRLRAVKSYVYEGGIRVPGILHWPGLRERGSVISEAVGFVDVLPTLCDGLGIAPPQRNRLDGTSLVPLIRGEAFERLRPLSWFFYRSSPEMAMRIGEMMVLGKAADTIPTTHRFAAPDMASIRALRFAEYELYDLTQDQEQFDNLMGSHPESKNYASAIDEQLTRIQTEGYQWQGLPNPVGAKRLKSDWVKYKRLSTENL